MSDDEKRFHEIIAEHGWQITQVRNTKHDSGPTFSYSTGLWKNFQHPELIIFGLSYELEGMMINNAGQDIKNKVRSFSANKYYNDFLEGFDILMIDVENDAQRKKHATWADWFYERKQFPLLQCVWPSTNGIWPWEDAANDDFRQMQPLLSKHFKP